MSFPAGTILDAGGRPVASSDIGFASDYEGAGTGSRLGDWGLSSAGPSAAVFRNLVTLRKRARDGERNNPNIKGGLDSYVSNLVGTSISPSWNLDNQEQKEELQQVWEDSLEEADFYGISDFYGTQDLVARSVVRDGEVLGRFHDVDPSMGLVVPLQVQLLEADHLDASYNDISPDGNEIRFGIEWKNGRRYRYWPWADHPGESFLTRDNITRIPIDASDMVHVFRPLRAGQARGISWLAPILLKLHDIDRYDDAEVVRKKIAALWAGFIYSDTPVGSRTVSPGGAAEKIGGVPYVKLQPNTFTVLKNGQKVAFSEASDVGNNYLDFMRVQMRMVARGIGITYEQLTGDLEGVTYTSLRAGLIEIRRLLKTIIARTLVFQYNRPYINRWVYTGVLNNCFKTISVSEYLQHPRTFHRVDWNPDGWDFTDPVKDRVAEMMDIRNGIEPRGKKIASRGGTSAAKVDRQNETERDSAVSLGLVYDCYPSQTTGSGAMQKIEEKVVLDAAKTE